MTPWVLSVTRRISRDPWSSLKKEKMKHQLIWIIIILLSSSVSCQSEKTTENKKDIAEQIVDKVCGKLSDKNSNVEEYLLMAKDLIQNDKVINKKFISEIDKNKTSSKIVEKFDVYLKFLFRRDCAEYRKEYDKIDKNYDDRFLIREGYVNNRDLIFDLFDDAEFDELVQYFEVKDIEKLKEHLAKIKVGFKKAKDQTYVHTTKLNRDELVFYNNLLNYVTGDEKLRIVFVFDITGEKIIKYTFNYGQIEIIEE